MWWNIVACWYLADEDTFSLILVHGDPSDQSDDDELHPATFFSKRYPNVVITDFKVFDQDTTISTWPFLRERAQALLNQVKGKALLPLIFMGHGLGGSVIKKVKTAKQARFPMLILFLLRLSYWPQKNQSTKKSRRIPLARYGGLFPYATVEIKAEQKRYSLALHTRRRTSRPGNIKSFDCSQPQNLSQSNLGTSSFSYHKCFKIFA